MSGRDLINRKRRRIRGEPLWASAGARSCETHRLCQGIWISSYRLRKEPTAQRDSDLASLGLKTVVGKLLSSTCCSSLCCPPLAVSHFAVLHLLTLLCWPPLTAQSGRPSHTCLHSGWPRASQHPSSRPCKCTDHLDFRTAGPLFIAGQAAAGFYGVIKVLTGVIKASNCTAETLGVYFKGP